MLRSSSTSSASPERLWELVGDLDRWDEVLPTVTSIRPLQVGPTAVGSRFEVKQPGLAKTVFEVTDWRPGESFTWVSRQPGVRSTAVHGVRGEGDGSRLDLSLDFSGPLAVLVRLVLGRKAQRMVATEAQTFARLAETR